MKQRVLITGASGFVGYHLIKEAIASNLEVFAAVRKSSTVTHLREFDIKYTYPDFSNIESLKAEFIANKYDYVIHAAGVTKARSEDEYNLINATYTANLAKSIIETGISLKRFVLISSLAAIGPLHTLEGVISDSTSPNPVTAYGRSKLLGETKLKEFNTLNYTILRPTGVYGPRDTGIFIFFQQINKGFEPYIGKIEQKLSLIYVTDLAKVTVQALFKGNKKAYNLSDGNYYSRYELANIAKNVLKHKTFKIHLPVNFIKLIAYIAEKLSSLNNKAAVLNVEKLNELMAINWNCDIELAKTDLGFNPLYDLDGGVTETLNWYKANKWL